MTTTSHGDKPEVPKPRLDVIRESLGPEFIYWANSKPVLRDGVVTKPPFDPKTGNYARINAPSTLGDFDIAAHNVEQGKFPWIGAALVEPNGIVMLDIDNALQTLKRNPNIGRAIQRYRERGGYVEVSQSGKGLHAIVRAKLDGNIKGAKLEAYSNHRQFVVTGYGAEGSKVLEDQGLVDTFVSEIAHHKGQRAEKDSADNKEVPLTRAGKLTAEVVNNATKATRKEVGTRAFDHGDWTKLHKPLEGDLADLGADGGDGHGWESQSSADLALCGAAARALAKLGVADPEELTNGVRKIMERSALSDRPKWARNDYSRETIAKAIAPIIAHQKQMTQGGEIEPDLRRGDILAAELLIRHHGRNIRYCSERGVWLLWTGTRWRWVDLDDIVELAKKTAGRVLEDAGDLLKLDPEKGGKLVKFAVKYHNLESLHAMIKAARSDPRIRVRLADLDADKHLLGVGNGYVDLRTGQFFPPDPEKLITRCAGVDYVAGATCPQWLAAMNTTHEGNQEVIDFLARAYGYTFSGYNDEEVMFICYGHGSNGKSVQQDIIHFVGGDIVCMGDISLLVFQKNDTRVPNALAATAGARQLSLNETTGGDELDTRSLKVLAGREPITARFLHQEFFTFQSTATPWLRTNHRPIVKDDSDGVWRRMILIPFRHKFTVGEIIARIEERLRAEASGILNWIIAGAVEYFSDGLRIPECIRRESDTYRSESDVMGQYLDEATEINPTFKVEQSDLWGNWQWHCRNNGHHPGTKHTFTRRLRERGFTPWQSNNRRYYQGLHLRGSQG